MLCSFFPVHLLSAIVVVPFLSCKKLVCILKCEKGHRTTLLLAFQFLNDNGREHCHAGYCILSSMANKGEPCIFDSEQQPPVHE